MRVKHFLPDIVPAGVIRGGQRRYTNLRKAWGMVFSLLVYGFFLMACLGLSVLIVADQSAAKATVGFSLRVGFAQ